MEDFATILSTVLGPIDLYDALLFFMLIFTRFLTMTMTVPFLGAMIIPAPIRIGVAATASWVVMLMFLPKIPPVSLEPWFSLAFLFIKEALLGFVVGFLASLIFHAYELCGQLIDFARAASMAKLLVPQLKHQSSPLGTLLFQLSLAIFLALGFHRPVLEALFSTYQKYPPHKLVAIDFTNANIFGAMLGLLSNVFEFAFKLALPIVLITFLIDLGFGLINRVAPQINAYFLSLPAKIVGGLIMFFFSLPFLIDEFPLHYQSMTAVFFNLVGSP